VSSTTSDKTYGYDTIGNLTTKAGVNYSYPTAGQARPHTPSAVAGVNRTYDANGNLTGGDSRSYTWNYDNKPSSVTGIDLVQEQYGYDADTNRVYRTRNGITTFYLGQWEEDSTGVKKQYYSFGGSTVAMRDSSTNVVTYLHSDHLGSVSLATTSNGTIASQQYFDPWGKVKSGGIGQTSLNYTGQRLDGTGLLYYNARYYDPALGKFLSPDNVSDGLNRYAYVHNNPLKNTDPTGHCTDVISCPVELGTFGSFICGPVCGGIGVVIGLGIGGYITYQAYNAITNDNGSGDNLADDVSKTAKDISNAVSGAENAQGQPADGDKSSPQLGDLTQGEIDKIQSTVDQAGRPIEVVGSAARAERRHVGEALPIGKENVGGKSDIDYVLPPSSFPYYDGKWDQLPDVDPGHGPVPGTHNPYIGPAVRFEPGSNPKYVPKISEE